jgi:hypothetical protein
MAEMNPAATVVAVAQDTDATAKVDTVEKVKGSGRPASGPGSVRSAAPAGQAEDHAGSDLAASAAVGVDAGVVAMCDSRCCCC